MARCILLVEDDDVTCDLVSSMLTARGYEVETARDGVNAVERIARGGYDLALLDDDMQVGDAMRCRGVADDKAVIGFVRLDCGRHADGGEAKTRDVHAYTPTSRGADALTMAGLPA